MISPSPHPSTYRSEPGGGPADPSVNRFVTLFVIGGFVVLIAVFGSSEVSRWYHAHARNALIDQKYDDAVESINKALAWNPESSELINLRAAARMENKDYEGCIADFDSLLAKTADDGETTEREIMYMAEKANALQRLGRYTEMLAIWDDIIAHRKEAFRLRNDHDSRYAYALSLNNQAYMLAQAYAATEDGELYDVKQGLEQIQQSIEIRQVDDDPLLLDTLGYLLLFNDQPDEALRNLEKAIELTEQEHAVKRNQYREFLQKVVDQRPVQEALNSLDEQYSIILHHRGEAYLALGQLEKSAADIKEAIRLGYDPENGIW